MIKTGRKVAFSIFLYEDGGVDTEELNLPRDPEVVSRMVGNLRMVEQRVSMWGFQQLKIAMAEKEKLMVLLEQQADETRPQ